MNFLLLLIATTGCDLPDRPITAPIPVLVEESTPFWRNKRPNHPWKK